MVREAGGGRDGPGRLSRDCDCDIVRHSYWAVGACPSREQVVDGRRAWSANSHGVCGRRGSRGKAGPVIPAVCSGRRAVHPGWVEVREVKYVGGVCNHWCLLSWGVILAGCV